MQISYIPKPEFWTWMKPEFWTWIISVSCSCRIIHLVWKSFLSFSSHRWLFFLMENQSKCWLTEKICYKTTLSSGCCYSWTAAVSADLYMWSAASWRPNAVCSDYVNHGCVWVISPLWPDRWRCVCVCGELGGANSDGLWNEGFPPLSFSLFFLFPYFLWVSTICHLHSCNSKNRTSLSFYWLKDIRCLCFYIFRVIWEGYCGSVPHKRNLYCRCIHPFTMLLPC